MTRKQKRLAVIAGGMSFIIVAVLLVMFAFSQSVAYFYMPGDLANNPIAPGTRIRLGGLVGEGSVIRGEGSVVRFAVTDPSGDTVNVRYQGILPDLFREGQGVVVEGKLTPDGRLTIDFKTTETDVETVLAAVRAAGISIHDLAIREPALEDVFLALTYGSGRTAA